MIVIVIHQELDSPRNHIENILNTKEKIMNIVLDMDKNEKNNNDNVIINLKKIYTITK